MDGSNRFGKRRTSKRIHRAAREAKWIITIDRKSTRLNSSHGYISYAVFCLKKKRSAFVIVDHRDIPGPNEVILIERDQPVLAAGYVRHVHEPVVLLGHRSRDALRPPVRAVDVVVAPEPPVLDFRVPPRPDPIQYGRANVLKRLKIEKGDVERALAQAPGVVSGTY